MAATATDRNNDCHTENREIGHWGVYKNGKMKGKQEVNTQELRTVLKKYEDFREDVHVGISIPWENAWKKANTDNLHRLVALSHERLSEEGHTANGLTSKIRKERNDIYIRTEKKSKKPQ